MSDQNSNRPTGQNTTVPPPSQGAEVPTSGSADRVSSGDGARPERRQPAYYYGSMPTMRSSYGGGGGAAYGPGLYKEGEGEGGEEALLGPLTLRRVLRITLQKWPTLVVSVLLGLGAGFAYYKTAPVVYKSWSVIEMYVRPLRVMPGQGAVINDQPGTIDEIFNTRLAKLRSRAVIDKVALRVRADFPSLGLNDDEMFRMLFENVEFALQRRSRLVQITARHGKPEVAKAIADAYSVTAKDFSMDENKEASDSAVSWLKTTAETQRRQLEKADQAVLDFRAANQIDVLENQKKAVDQIMQQINGDLARVTDEAAIAAEMLNTLTAIQNHPEQISALPEFVPRASEIAIAQQNLQNAIVERDTLLLRYTAKHPEVQQRENAVQVCRAQYLDTVLRARETAAANLEQLRKTIEVRRVRQEENDKLGSELEQKIVAVKMRLEQLEREREVSDLSFRAVLRRMEEARLASDESAATINLIEGAFYPRRPVSPDPRVAFTTGPLLGLFVGFLFVMLLDRLEDRITGTADIEQHMSTRVLCLVPHVPRVKREELVMMSATKKFSRLAEAFAGLRGVLESPRYREFNRVVLVVSTQPAEGKTSTASNLASSFAMTGKRTLLVDFDLRRPRIGDVFNTPTEQAASLMDVLNRGDPAAFAGLPIPSGIDNLDLVITRASAHISPANIMGSGVVSQFFEWARAHYAHVVVDSPPVGVISDAVVLGTLVDSVIMVCRLDRSRYGAIRHAIRQFVEAGARVMGVVVNGVDFNRSSYFSNYDYQRYGGGYRYGRYGRYSGYYKRNLNGGAAAAEGVTPDTPAGSGRSAADGALDADDDE